MRATKRDLAGRRIVAVATNKFRANTTRDGGRATWAFEPELTLDNGRVVWFEVQETGVGKYGVEICISERWKGGTQ